MIVTTKLRLLSEELKDLEKLIELDLNLVEKYPEDNLLKATLLQYLERKINLLNELKNESLIVKGFGTRKIKPHSVIIDNLSIIDEKQANELKIRTVM